MHLSVVEGHLLALGCELLERKRSMEAIDGMKYGVSRFPASANAHDSLGEGYMNAGDRARAIENYEKSLNLNPKNTNAVEKLK